MNMRSSSGAFGAVRGAAGVALGDKRRPCLAARGSSSEADCAGCRGLASCGFASRAAATSPPWADASTVRWRRRGAPGNRLAAGTSYAGVLSPRFARIYKVPAADEAGGGLTITQSNRQNGAALAVAGTRVAHCSGRLDLNRAAAVTRPFACNAASFLVNPLAGRSASTLGDCHGQGNGDGGRRG